MRHTLLPVALLAAFLLQGCSTVRVETDFDRAADFSRYRTYQWIEHEKHDDENPLMRDELIRSHVLGALDAQMAAKGYSRIDAGRPDFLVAYFFVTRNRVDVHHHYGYYWHTYPSVRRYREGTLIIDVVDPQQRQLVWRGWATGTLHRREQAREDIERSVIKMLDRFPPK